MISCPHNPDTLKNFLEGETSTTGSLDDLLRAYYTAQGASGGSIQDLERQALLQNTTGSGSNADLWNKYFSENSLTSVSDWISNGGFSSLSTSLAALTTLSGAKPFAFHDFDRNVYGQPALGPELVTNGDLSNGLTGWTVVEGTNGTVGVVGGEVSIRVSSGFAVSYVEQSLGAFPAGGTVVLSADVRETGAGARPRFSLLLTPFASVGSFDPDPGSVTHTWVIPAGTTDVKLRFQNPGPGDTTVFADNISVKLVDTSLDPITAAVADVLSISKGSAKYVLQPDGTYTQVASGAAIARSYNPAVGKTGRLDEDASENYIVQSNLETGWSAIDGVIELASGVNAVTGGDLYRLRSTAQSGIQIPLAQENTTVFAGQNCFWVEVDPPSGCDNVVLQQFGFDATEETNFHFSGGIPSVSAGAEHSGSGVIPVGGGRYKLYVVFDATSDQVGSFRVLLSETEDVNLRRITDPDGTESVNIHHAQCEPGIYPTSPIVTNGSALPRLTDNISASDLTLAAVAQQTELTYYAEVAFNPDLTTGSNANQTIFDSDYDGTGSRVLLDIDHLGRVRFYVLNGATLQYNRVIAVADLKALNKIAFAMADGDIEAAVNGVSLGPRVGDFPNGTMNALTFSKQTGGAFRGEGTYFFKDAWFGSRLPAATLVEMTT